MQLCECIGYPVDLYPTCSMYGSQVRVTGVSGPVVTGIGGRPWKQRLFQTAGSKGFIIQILVLYGFDMALGKTMGNS
jgi:hypothetical protein